MKTFDCIAIGGTVLDTFVMLGSIEHRADPHDPEKFDQCFILGSKSDVKKIVQQSGGGASNSCVTFARQRLSCVLLSQVGEDAAAKLVIDEMQTDGVNTGFVQVLKGAKTGQSVVLVDPDAERTILTDRGSAGTFTAQTLSILETMKSRWVYVTSQNGSIAALETIFSWARDNGVKVAWNPGRLDIEKGIRSLKKFVAACAFLNINKDEAEQLLGEQGNVAHLTQQLRTLGVERVVVTNGAEDLAMIDGSKHLVKTPHRIKAVDQTGAGDAFGSGTVAGLLLGLPFAESIDFGLTNSEHVIGHIGAKTGILYRK